MEYLELTGDSQFKAIIELSENIEKLKHKIVSVEAALTALSCYKSDKLIQQLLELGYKVEEMKEWDGYFQSLQNIHKRLGSVMITLKIKEKEFENLKKGYGKTKNDGDFFDRVLLQLSRYQGYQINSLTITVKQFAIILNNYIKEGDKWQRTRG